MKKTAACAVLALTLVLLAVCCLAEAEGVLQLETMPSEYTVYLEGLTRVRLDEVEITEASCRQMNPRRQPVWTLTRVSGTSLTVRAEGTSRYLDDGTRIFGCQLTLYSLSKTGDTVYDLTCSAGGESVTVRFTVHAVAGGGTLPSVISFSRTAFTAQVDELVTVDPLVTCTPAEAVLPQEASLTCVMDDQALSAMNQGDYFVSKSRCTFSFHTPGTYQIRFTYTLSNLVYAVPVTLRILDGSGAVVVQAARVTLNHTSLSLQQGESMALTPVFTPLNATNQQVTWTSSRPEVASVSSQGLVEARSLGNALITCTPADTRCAPVTCYVSVEEWFTVENVEDTYSLYLQGAQTNVLFRASLSQGTVKRVRQEELHIEWLLIPDEDCGVETEMYVAPDRTSAWVETEELLRAGSSGFTLVCETEISEWTHHFTIEVEDLGESTPQTVTIAQREIRMEVDEEVTVDFTPVCSPAGAAIPDGMYGVYTGYGGFYEARTVFQRSDDSVTLAFDREGTFLLMRTWRMGNLSYTASCWLIVGEPQEEPAMLRVEETDYTVYMNGATARTAVLSIDSSLYEILEGQVVWGLERLSGSSTSAVLDISGGSAALLVLETAGQGQDLWRVSCTIQDRTVTQDITVNVVQPRMPLPASVSLVTDAARGMIGSEISLPLAVQCLPEGSGLPDAGDEFWSFRLAQGSEDALADWSVEDSLLLAVFRERGYYTGTLAYSAGNIRFEKEVYFTVLDEEEEISPPAQLTLFLQEAAETVYPEGETQVRVARACLSESPNACVPGGTGAYAREKGIRWQLTRTAGEGISLSIRETVPGQAELVLESISGAGECAFLVSCTVDGQTCSAAYTLRVAAQAEERPDPVLSQSLYQVHAGGGLIIRDQVTGSGGAALQCAKSWEADSALAAMNDQYEACPDGWYAVFYQPGLYHTSVRVTVGNLIFDLPLTIRVLSGEAEPAQAVLLLPAGLRSIGEEAFAALPVQAVDARGTALREIGKNAFLNCAFLTDVYLPASVESIDPTAFAGCGQPVIHCAAGSYAESWAADRHLPVSHDMTGE